MKRNENRPPGKILEPEIIAGLYMKLKPPALEEGFEEIQVIPEEEKGEPGPGDRGI